MPLLTRLLAPSGATLILSLAGPPLFGQDCRMYLFDGVESVDRFGQNVDGAGDVDADGHADLIVGAPLNDTNGAEAGMVRVFSGLDGTLLYERLGDDAGDQFGKSVSGAGDANGDGYDDFVVGAPYDDNVGSNSGSVTLFSGRDGSVLHVFNGFSALEIRELGWSVGGAGDVNGDGYDDVIAGGAASSAGGLFAGHVRVYSGSTGTLLYPIDGQPGDRLGGSVNGAGDVDADGYDDFVVSGWASDRGGTDSGVVIVYSGRTGALRHAFAGSPGDELGNDLHGPSVAGAGDVNGDGYDDVIAGARVHSGPGANAGRVRVWSGRDGSVLHTLVGTPGAFFGTSVGAVGDADEDGYADFVVGASLGGATFQGTAQIFSGLDGHLLTTFEGDSPVDLFGRSVAPAGDVNGDGFVDLIVGADQDDHSADDSGSASVFHARTVFWRRYCLSNPNSTGGAALASFAGSNSIAADDFTLHAAPVPDEVGIFFFGASRLPALPFGDGFLCVAARQLRLLPPSTPSSFDLAYQVDFTSPPGSRIEPGSTWDFQAWFRDSAAGGSGYNTSDGIEVTFCP